MFDCLSDSFRSLFCLRVHIYNWLYYLLVCSACDYTVTSNHGVKDFLGFVMVLNDFGKFWSL